jgi:hypothetical protein
VTQAPVRAGAYFFCRHSPPWHSNFVLESNWRKVGACDATGSKRVSPTSIGLREAGADISLAASATALCRVGKNVALAGDLTELESQLKGEP